MDKSKRNMLLRGRVEIRPPWSLAGDAFFKACRRCDLCVAACPTKIIVNDRFRYPLIDFRQGLCTFCEACRQACIEHAKESADSSAFGNDDTAWSISAHFTDKCLARRGIVCRTCEEECAGQAISFFLQTGGISVPVVDSKLCTGCGACLSPCPVQAVRIY